MYVCIFAGARLGSGFAVCYMGLSLHGGRSHILYSDMTFDFDACASHVMLCASFGCLLHHLWCLGIVWCVCIVCGAWSSVGNRSLVALRYFLLFLLLPCSIWYSYLLKITYLWTSLDITWSRTLDAGCDGCLDILCCAIDCCRFYPPLTVVGTVFIASLIKLLRVV